VGGMYEKALFTAWAWATRARSKMARAFTLVWSGKGIATFTATVIGRSEKRADGCLRLGLRRRY